MIAGIGVDLCRCERLKSFLEDREKGLRFFGPDEYQYAVDRKTGALQSLAACFAAKEAFGKALGTGLAGLILTDMQVVHTETGKPELKLTGTAAAACEAAGIDAVHLSLTHESDMAAAYVILEKRN